MGQAAATGLHLQRQCRHGSDLSRPLLELTDPKAIAAHAMEGADPTFAERMRPGDIIVVGRNFGRGSSREHAVIALKEAGVGAVLALSFGRIFYRNAINLGLPAIRLAAEPGVAEGICSPSIWKRGLLPWRTGKSSPSLPSPPEIRKIIQGAESSPWSNRNREDEGRGLGPVPMRLGEFC